MQLGSANPSLRPLISGAATTAGALLSFSILPSAATAQQASSNPSPARTPQGTVELDTL